MLNAYDPAFRRQLQSIAKKDGVRLEEGVRHTTFVYFLLYCLCAPQLIKHGRLRMGGGGRCMVSEACCVIVCARAWVCFCVQVFLAGVGCRLRGY